MRGRILLAVLAYALPAIAWAVADEWFRIGDEALRHWVVERDAQESLRVTVQPKQAGVEAPRKIAVIYAKASPAYDIAMTKLLSVFNEKGVAAAFLVFNFQDSPGLGRVVLEAARRERAELIFAMGSESTAFLVDAWRQGSIPVVTVCAKDPVLLGQMKNYDTGSGNHFAFTSLNMPVDVQLAYLLELKPRLRNLGILVDAQNLSAMQTQADPIAVVARGRGIVPISIAVTDPSQSAEELAWRIPTALAEMRRTDPGLEQSLFLVTGSTAVFREIETINRYAEPVPVLSMVPEVVRAGDASAVLSIGISFESNAHLAAVYGIEVLSGKARPGDLKVGVVSPPDIAINFRRARRIGLKIPFSFFETASYIYDYQGRPVRQRGVALLPR